ncbi:unnamed protein product [Paramecium sonneborni]|uniref:EF-hand domain-containing protein n=1 Tax=Paramecium sonneborni TaxID=65129 RepID=A0A8S1NAB3_9CILI|nr:unnamed protein product [Paramecium sonneborni]
MQSQLLAVVTLETNDIPNYIHIYENDDIDLLIDAFCDLNCIKQGGKQFIIQEIKSNLNQVRNSKKDFIIQAEQKNQQSFEIEKQDQLKKNNQILKLQNNHQLYKESLSKTTIKQGDELLRIQIQEQQNINKESLKLQLQNGNQFFNNNERLRQQLVSPNYRYEKQSSEIDLPITNKIIEFSNQRVQQQSKQKKKIFDANQPKIKYIHNLDILRDIFRQLDSDKDGQISCEQINLKIQEQTLQRIAPVLFHMQEQRMVLDFDSFACLIISFDILIY